MSLFRNIMNLISGKDKTDAEQEDAVLLAYEESLKSVDIEVLRTAPLEALSECAEFAVEANSGAYPIPSECAPLLREVFSKYELIEFSASLAHIGLSDVDRHSGLIFIGFDTGSAVAVAPASEVVYLWSDGVVTSSHPTVFHWILLLNYTAFINGLAVKEYRFG